MIVPRSVTIVTAGSANIQGNQAKPPIGAASFVLGASNLATVSIVDYVTVVGGIGGSYATLTFAPDAAVGIESATVLIERVCG